MNEPSGREQGVNGYRMVTEWLQSATGQRVTIGCFVFGIWLWVCSTALDRGIGNG
jgi:hypothetical protein